MLLFLHGFLGQKEDWDLLFSQLPVPARAIDLPGHGGSPMAGDIALAIREQVPKATCVVGYSAGGRVALELKERFPSDYGSLVLLSTHLGLTSKEERMERQEKDAKWIHLLNTRPFEEFLEKWYAQELFASFRNSPHFLAALSRRKKQAPHLLAQFMNQYSIASKKPSKVPEGTILVYGEWDLKYERLYRKLGRIETTHVIKNAGHAVHLENPASCSKVIYEHYRNCKSPLLA
ncbi:MAG: alpha/beta fold hydrolase [Simkaniaceae bacterium]|nr:alpha/beta fold hydrolase [Candidatus Sacchlamyda saccharinae]